MPIVFDQIIGTVAPETPTNPASSTEETQSQPFALERQVRQIQIKHHRRQSRLSAN
jgi:hypothetical protein